VKGILADIHLSGPVEDLVRLMQDKPWAELWSYLGLALFTFEDLGLAPTATDLEIWQRCQAEELILITNNRNSDSPESLEATLRQCGTTNSLPVITIANLDNFRKSRAYAERVVERLYEYLLDIENLRGTGRAFVP
jgi:predicted nuclease of predicted toxin-antitoxin system